MTAPEMRDKLLPLAPVVILLAVAGLQAYNVRAHELTRWKGGGFGMFSTVDEPRRRVVRCYLVNDDGRELPLRIPKSLDRLLWEVRAIPTADRVSRLAREVANDFNRSAERAGELVSARQVRVRVWRSAFDSTNDRLRLIQIVEQTLER